MTPSAWIATAAITSSDALEAYWTAVTFVTLFSILVVSFPIVLIGLLKFWQVRRQKRRLWNGPR